MLKNTYQKQKGIYCLKSKEPLSKIITNLNRFEISSGEIIILCLTKVHIFKNWPYVATVQIINESVSKTICFSYKNLSAE